MMGNVHEDADPRENQIRELSICIQTPKYHDRQLNFKYYNYFDNIYVILCY